MAASKPGPMEVPNPKRILLIGPPESGLLELLTDLTGSAPTTSTTASADTPPSLADLSHSFNLKTPYYNATIPIWLDEIPLSATSSSIQATDASSNALSSPSPASIWASDFLLPEAREVLSALGSIILLFRKPATATEHEQIKDLIRNVGKVVREGLDGGIGGSWEGVALAVAWKRAVVPGVEVASEEWEDLCMEEGGGMEWVDGEADGKGRNEYGEKSGIARLLEALEANDWAGDDEHDIDGFGLDSDSESGGLGAEATELEMEMFGMKRAIHQGGDVGEEFAARADGEGDGKEDDGDEDGVNGLEGLMMRMQGIRDMGADMPEAERKKFAAKAVRDIMRTL